MVQAEDATRSIGFIRDEMRFELDTLHNRINALISAEAFLTIAFTMSLGNAEASFVAPTLSVVGCVLALLAWPGVNTSTRIINEWNTLLTHALENSSEGVRAMWRPSIFLEGARSSDFVPRKGMIFSRSMPVLFAIAWIVFGGVAIGRM